MGPPASCAVHSRRRRRRSVSTLPGPVRPQRAGQVAAIRHRLPVVAVTLETETLDGTPNRCGASSDPEIEFPHPFGRLGRSSGHSRLSVRLDAAASEFGPFRERRGVGWRLWRAAHVTSRRHCPPPARSSRLRRPVAAAQRPLSQPASAAARQSSPGQRPASRPVRRRCRQRQRPPASWARCIPSLEDIARIECGSAR